MIYLTSSTLVMLRQDSYFFNSYIFVQFIHQFQRKTGKKRVRTYVRNLSCLGCVLPLFYEREGWWNKLKAERSCAFEWSRRIINTVLDRIMPYSLFFFDFVFVPGQFFSVAWHINFVCRYVYTIHTTTRAMKSIGKIEKKYIELAGKSISSGGTNSSSHFSSSYRCQLLCIVSLDRYKTHYILTIRRFLMAPREAYKHKSIWFFFLYASLKKRNFPVRC